MCTNKELNNLNIKCKSAYNERQNIIKQIETLNNALTILEENNCDDRTVFNFIYDTIDKLTTKSEIFLKIVDNLKKDIKTIQTNCNHDWVYEGHDSHKDHYKCSKCDALESW